MMLFIGGLFMGAVVGVIVMSLMAMASSNSRREDEVEWEEFNKSYNANDWKYQSTNIKCPECGRLLVKDISVVLATYPVKYKYECHNCGWFGVK